MISHKNMQERIALIAEKMKDLEKKFNEPDAPVVQLRDKVKQLLREAHLMYREKINSKWMGVHSENRYSDGVVPSDVLALISDIFSHGFSLLALQDPTCCELPPVGHEKHTKEVEFNVNMVQGSGGQLPDYEDSICMPA